MWPLSIVLLLATAAPQQNAPAPQQGFIGKVPQQIQMRRDPMFSHRLAPEEEIDKNTCYAIRSYHFERQDGQAPVLTAMTTCTPSRMLEQKRVTAAPHVQYVPLGLKSSDQKQPQ
jgi:hypothetical protein